MISNVDPLQRHLQTHRLRDLRSTKLHPPRPPLLIFIVQPFLLLLDLVLILLLDALQPMQDDCSDTSCVVFCHTKLFSTSCLKSPTSRLIASCSLREHTLVDVAGERGLVIVELELELELGKGRCWWRRRRSCFRGILILGGQMGGNMEGQGGRLKS